MPFINAYTMKVWATTVITFFALGWTIAQPPSQLNDYLLTGGSTQGHKAEERITNLVNKLQAKRGKSDRQFLGSVFSVAHRQLLKEYKQYSGFGELFTNGRYDCLTATALYSLVLDRLGFEYSIVETNYHIFLMVKTDEGEVLIESTDPIDGFVDNPKEVAERLKSYKESGPSPGEGFYDAQFNLFQAVDTHQLVGLLYFNQAVKAFNNQQWAKAADLLEYTKKYYVSPRVDEMETLLHYVAEPGVSLVQRDE